LKITGAEDKIDGLLEVLRPYGVLEMVRTGIVAMRRGKSSVAGSNTGTDHDVTEEDVFSLGLSRAREFPNRETLPSTHRTPEPLLAVRLIPFPRKVAFRKKPAP